MVVATQIMAAKAVRLPKYVLDMTSLSHKNCINYGGMEGGGGRISAYFFFHG